MLVSKAQFLLFIKIITILFKPVIHPLPELIAEEIASKFVYKEHFIGKTLRVFIGTQVRSSENII